MPSRLPSSRSPLRPRLALLFYAFVIVGDLELHLLLLAGTLSLLRWLQYALLGCLGPCGLLSGPLGLLLLLLLLLFGLLSRLGFFLGLEEVAAELFSLHVLQIRLVFDFCRDFLQPVHRIDTLIFLHLLALLFRGASPRLLFDELSVLVLEEYLVALVVVAPDLSICSVLRGQLLVSFLPREEVAIISRQDFLGLCTYVVGLSTAVPKGILGVLEALTLLLAVLTLSKSPVCLASLLFLLECLDLCVLCNQRRAVATTCSSGLPPRQLVQDWLVGGLLGLLYDQAG